MSISCIWTQIIMSVEICQMHEMALCFNKVESMNRFQVMVCFIKLCNITYMWQGSYQNYYKMLFWGPHVLTPKWYSVTILEYDKGLNPNIPLWIYPYSCIPNMKEESCAFLYFSKSKMALYWILDVVFVCFQFHLRQCLHVTCNNHSVFLIDNWSCY